MRALLADYGEQTGELTPATGPKIFEAFYDRIGSYTNVQRLFELVVLWQREFGEGIGATAGEEDGALSVRRDALDSNFGGWGRLTYICGGWVPDAAPDAGVSGRVFLLNRFFGEGGLGSVFWGTLERCRESLGGDNIELRGRIQAYIAELQAGDDSGRVLIEYSGQFIEATPDATFEEAVDAAEKFTFDVGFVRDMPVMRVEVPDEGRYLVGLAQTESGFAVRIVDKNGDWNCLVALDGGTGRCERDGEELDW